MVRLIVATQAREMMTKRLIRKTRTLAGMLLGELNPDMDVPPCMLAALQDSGFVLIPHAVAPERLKSLVAAYNVVVASATGDDVRHAARPLE